MGDPETTQFGYFASGGWLLQGTFGHWNDDFLAMALAYVRTNSRLTQFQEDRDTIRPGSVGIQNIREYTRDRLRGADYAVVFDTAQSAIPD